MRVSDAGRAAIEQREGCRLRAYRDTVGVLTIGYGHTGRMSGPPVTEGMVITKAQADAFLKSDLEPIEFFLNPLAVRLNQSQTDALASFIFNIGLKAYLASTVRKRLEAHDFQGAADAMMMWVKPPELRERREAERAQFLSEPPRPQYAYSPPTFWQRLAAFFGRAA